MATSSDAFQVLRPERAKKLAVRFSDQLARYSIKGKGKAIFNQGQAVAGVYYLCEGLVKLISSTEDGGETILDIITPCSIIGEICRRGGATHSYSAVTLEGSTEVAYLKIEDLAVIIQSDWSLGLSLAQHLCVRLRAAYRTVGAMQLPVEERLLTLLARVMFLREGRHPKGQSRLPFTFRELAQFAQITPETLSRALRSLHDKGIISVEKKELRILKEETLQKYLDEPS